MKVMPVRLDITPVMSITQTELSNFYHPMHSTLCGEAHAIVARCIVSQTSHVLRLRQELLSHIEKRLLKEN